MVSEYTLALSEAELGRYQMMARQAVAREASQLAAAGVVAGATVADIGCGPAALSGELARLLAAAGLEVTSFEGAYNILTAPPGMRPPAWAARDAMLADGIVDDDVLHRWETALARHDSAPVRLTVFAPGFIAIGRRSA